MKSQGNEAIKELSITVLGSGHMRPASGTWGSLFAAVIFAGFWWAGRALALPTWSIDVVVALVGILLASWASVAWGQWAIDKFGRKDPKQFVLDEFAGQWVSLLWLPPLASAGFWPFAWVLGGQFVLFRIMDVIKPPPARQFERWPAGWGVLCDDLMAGVYAALVGQALWRLTPLAEWLGLS